MIYLGEVGGRLLYEFMPHEWNTCVRLGRALTESKGKSKKTTPHSGVHIEDVDILGMLGEFLAHYHYNEDFFVHLDEHSGDEGYDMIHDGAKFQIKATTANNNPRMCVKVADPQIADIYLLCRIDLERRVGALLGYATRPMVFKEENKGRLREDLPENYLLRESQLKRCSKP